jgi:alkanesulfonate monooxygenase SsuD/methylene tetrahydromethanopterin reductase-like flavin-dependent oxidoreductase (luciferase family)
MLDLVKRDPDMSDAEVTAEYMLREVCIVGDKDECIMQLNRLWEETGGFGTLLMIAHDMDNKPKWEQSIECLAKEVVPSFSHV